MTTNKKQKAEKPLPCPFCGTIPEFHYIKAAIARPEIDKPYWSLGCKDTSGCHVDGLAFGDTKADAVKSWNTRWVDPVIRECIEALYGVVRDVTPQIGKIVLSDYERLNRGMALAEHLRKKWGGK